ncbi:MAG: quinolinate synthase NadA [Bacillota bacterium]|nr:quinolinate synthase NadA [Bacillota bacterium]
MSDLKEKIKKLKKEKNAVILAHYYTDDEIQEVADYVGDSYYLAKIAAQTDAEVIVFCGVFFMGESAKILSPEKTVIMPDINADCPMARMITPQKIINMRKMHDDLAVVCYINSTADVKACCDVCVTSSNALRIVKNLKEKNIYFVPDENLGRYIAKQIPEKHFIYNNGYCPTHKKITAKIIDNAKSEHPSAKVLMHPECTPDALERADYIGSTSGIIEYATKSSDKEFIICTELGVMYELKKKNPDKIFYPASENAICPNMKLITLQKLASSLENINEGIKLEEKTMEEARRPLNKMLELAK